VQCSVAGVQVWVFGGCSRILCGVLVLKLKKRELQKQKNRNQQT
jgi:hypothetical protein